MKTVAVTVAACAALALGGCGTLSGPAGSDAAAKVLGNLEHCKRTYQASVGGLGVPGGSLFIECPARPFEGADAPAGP